jgi:hypothetical protein
MYFSCCNLNRCALEISDALSSGRAYRDREWSAWPRILAASSASCSSASAASAECLELFCRSWYRSSSASTADSACETDDVDRPLAWGTSRSRIFGGRGDGMGEVSLGGGGTASDPPCRLFCCCCCWAVATASTNSSINERIGMWATSSWYDCRG